MTVPGGKRIISCDNLPLWHQSITPGAGPARGRSAMVQAVFQYMTAREGVWFAAGSQLYDFCKNNKE